jgi:hypothetical protein
MADAIAARIVTHEPLFGGTAGLPFRSAGRRLAAIASEATCVVKAV